MKILRLGLSNLPHRSGTRFFKITDIHLLWVSGADIDV